MRVFLLAVLLAGLVPAASAARRDELSDAEKRRFLHASRSALAQLDSGRDLAEFLSAQPVDIRLDRRLGSAGLYEDGRVFLHAGSLAGDLDNLEEAGLRGDEAVDALAWAWLPVLAHELEHVRTRQALELAIGVPYAYVDRDDEAVSFVREVRITREMNARFPARLRLDELGPSRREGIKYFLGLGPGDFDAFTEQIEGMFSSAPQLRLMDREQLRTWAQGTKGYWDGKSRQERAAAAQPVGPAVRELHLRSADEAALAAARASHVVALTSDPLRFGIARDYFERRFGQARASWPR
jgi:hypothetical protein